jgi:hypothetical protein
MTTPRRAEPSRAEPIKNYQLTSLIILGYVALRLALRRQPKM